jgi:nicotinamide mononucleotide adenylyltransferase
MDSKSQVAAAVAEEQTSDIPKSRKRKFININDRETNLESSVKSVKFFYFIGRLNPPHSGHIKALNTLVEIANRNKCVPLILLGSGPRSERSLDNPITFEAKENFIRRKLNGEFIIRKMTNPAENVSQYIIEELEKKSKNITNVSITLVVGGKDEDATKLLFTLKFAEKSVKDLIPNAIVSKDVIVIEAEKTNSDSDILMSATKVRKDAYRTVINNSGFDGWPEEYKEFYGENAEQIYNEILFPIRELSEEERLNVLHNYITSSILPSTNKNTKKKRKIGGTKKKRKSLKKKKSHKHRK